MNSGLRSAGGAGLVLVSDICRNTKLENRKSKPSANCSKDNLPCGLQPPCVAERSHCEEHQQARHGHGYANEPARHVAGPGAKGRVEPAQSKKGKHRAYEFMKKLPQHAPQAAEPLRLWTGLRACARRHNSHLSAKPAAEQERDRKKQRRKT